MDTRTEVIHELKTWPPYFNDIVEGVKTFEVRRNDRGYKVEDWLHLREWDPATGEYTGRDHHIPILYVLENHEGIAPGFCVLGLDTEGLVTAGLYRP